MPNRSLQLILQLDFQLTHQEPNLRLKNQQKMHYKNLKVWQKADELAIETYKITKNFPKDELYGITSQLRRASLSVPTNIVEGYARKGDKELARYINISIGSLAEVEYLLDFSWRLGFMKEEDFRKISSLREYVGKLLWNFYKKIAK